MPMLAGVEYEELACEELDLGPVRKLRCDAADKLPLCRALLGRIERPDTSIVESSVSPEHPDAPGFFVRELTVETTASLDGTADQAVLTVAYSRPELIPGF